MVAESKAGRCWERLLNTRVSGCGLEPQATCNAAALCKYLSRSLYLIITPFCDVSSDHGG